MELRHLSDQDLLSDVTKIIGSQRELTAHLIAHLAEIEERRLHLLAGFSSMFEFCVRELRLSEGEAFRRLVAARLGRRFPLVYSLLASGAVHLSALELLHQRLTEENHAELLDAVSGKSKREVQACLAARFPRPDRLSTIRRQASIEPLSETRFRVEFTASDELRQKLELCRDLMSHANPSRELGVVIERAVDLLLTDLEKKRLARTKRPRRDAGTVRAKPGRVTNATRRSVYERDGIRCTYVSPEGRRCEARAFLELDHVNPLGLGGGCGPENLRVRCRAHNQLWAEQVYGREHVERSVHFRQRKWKREQHGTHDGEKSVRTKSELPSRTLEKVRLALKGMGFRDAQARQAIAEVERRHAGTASSTIEQALREALLVATTKSA